MTTLPNAQATASRVQVQSGCQQRPRHSFLFPLPPRH